VKGSRESTGSAFTLIESRTGSGAPPHIHTREDEAMYVLAGLIVVRSASESTEAGPGRSFTRWT